MQIFTNEKFGNIRTIIGEDGAPRFCLVDLCKALKLSTNGITRRLGDDVITNHPILDSIGRQQNGLFVNEETILLDSGRTVIHTCWTQRGRMFLYFFLKEKGILPLMER